MAKQSFSTGQILTAAQMTSLQQTAMGGGTPVVKTTSYVLTAADAGTVIQMNSASSTTITVNTALFAAGDAVWIQNIGAGVCTITAGTATVTTAGSLALVQWEGGQLYFTSASASIFFDYIQAGVSIPLTTKGDLFGYDTGNARIPIGTNNQVLTADSTQALGLKWATPAGGAYTSLATGSLSGSAVSISSISSSYTDLYLQIRGSNLSTNASERIRPNGATTGYMTGGFSGSTAGFLGYQEENNGIYMNLPATDTNKSGITTNEYVLYFWDYANTTTHKAIVSYRLPWVTTTNRGAAAMSITRFGSTSAISSIDITVDSGTFSGGTYTLYGVK